MHEFTCEFTLPNLRPDWCMNVTKLKMYFLSFFVANRTEGTSRFLLEQFHWLAVSELVNFHQDKRKLLMYWTHPSLLFQNLNTPTHVPTKPLLSGGWTVVR